MSLVLEQEVLASRLRILSTTIPIMCEESDRLCRVGTRFAQSQKSRIQKSKGRAIAFVGWALLGKITESMGYFFGNAHHPP